MVAFFVLEGIDKNQHGESQQLVFRSDGSGNPFRLPLVVAGSPLRSLKGSQSNNILDVI